MAAISKAQSLLDNTFQSRYLCATAFWWEIEYFIALCELPLEQLKLFPKNDFESLRKIYKDFTEADALKIKETEKTTNHDVKAVEYFIKDKFDYQFLHF